MRKDRSRHPLRGWDASTRHLQKSQLERQSNPVEIAPSPLHEFQLGPIEREEQIRLKIGKITRKSGRTKVPMFWNQRDPPSKAGESWT